MSWQFSWDSQQGRDRAMSGRNNFFLIGPILFLYYEESLVSSNLNSKLLRFHCAHPNVHGRKGFIFSLIWAILLDSLHFRCFVYIVILLISSSCLLLHSSLKKANYFYFPSRGLLYISFELRVWNSDRGTLLSELLLFSKQAVWVLKSKIFGQTSIHILKWNHCTL